MPDLAVATIVAKNYVSFARVLAQSFLSYHPDVPFFVLLSDEVDGYFDPEPSRFVSCAKVSSGFPISRAAAPAMTASRSPSPRSPTC